MLVNLGVKSPITSWFLSLPPYLGVGVGVEERSECCAARTYGTKWDRKPEKWDRKPRKVGPQTPKSGTANPVFFWSARNRISRHGQDGKAGGS